MHTRFEGSLLLVTGREGESPGNEVAVVTRVGALSNYDVDDNNNVKKQLVLWAKQKLYTYISLKSTARLRREISQCDVLWRTWTYDDKFSFLYLNVDKAINNSFPGIVAYIWRIERFQIDAIKFERTQIHFFSDVFTAVVVVVA